MTQSSCLKLPVDPGRCTQYAQSASADADSRLSLHSTAGCNPADADHHPDAGVCVSPPAQTRNPGRLGLNILLILLGAGLVIVYRLVASDCLD